MDEQRPRAREVSAAQEEEFVALLKREGGRPSVLRLMVLKWAHQRLKEGLPRLALSIFLLGIVRRMAEVGSRQSSTEEMHKWRALGEPVVDVLREVEDQLSRVMMERNVRGQQLERQGRIDEAIALYEANVTDGFQGTHPYERLRILYTERKDYANAIRVCEAAIRNRVPFDRSHLVRLRELYRAP